jgi:Skp family chaperone for outer membrane proteins
LGRKTKNAIHLVVGDSLSHCSHYYEFAVKVLSSFVESFPDRSSQARKMIEEKLKPIDEEIQRLKEEKKEIELKVPEDVKQELREWVQERERIKKAMKQYSS